MTQASNPQDTQTTKDAEDSHPLAGKVSAKAKQLAQQGLDMAGNAKDKAEHAMGLVKEGAEQFITQKPLKSVLIAAAVGAGAALLAAKVKARAKDSKRRGP